MIGCAPTNQPSLACARQIPSILGITVHREKLVMTILLQDGTVTWLLRLCYPFGLFDADSRVNSDSLVSRGICHTSLLLVTHLRV